MATNSDRKPKKQPRGPESRLHINLAIFYSKPKGQVEVFVNGYRDFTDNEAFADGRAPTRGLPKRESLVLEIEDTREDAEEWIADRISDWLDHIMPRS